MNKFKNFLSTTIWSIKIVFSMSPLLVSLRFLLSILWGIETWINVFLISKLIDSIVSSNFSTINQDIGILIAIIIGINILFSSASWARSHIENYLQLKTKYHTHVLLYEKLNSLGVESLEDPEVTDEVQRFKDNYSMFNSFMWNMHYLLGALGYLLLNSISLIKLLPWFVALNLILLFPKFYLLKKFIQKIWVFDKSVTSEQRRAWGSLDKIANPASLKEIYITNSFNFLKNIFDGFYKFYLSEIKKIRIYWFFSTVFTRLIDYILIGFAFIVIVRSALNGDITVGLLTFYFTILSEFSSSVNQLIFAISNINEGQVRISEMKKFLSRTPKNQDGNIKIQKNIAPKIEFKNVSFKYPGSEKFIFKNFNLKINSGEKIAIVGANGAGKTTLVKLLTRIYTVNSGKILINGFDINKIKLSDWYDLIGALFQDFNTYPDLNVFDNIFIGRPEGDKHTKQIKEKVIEASKSSSAFEFIDKYPQKFNQVLSESYTGGIRPSTGQWQKIALARFFYRDPKLLILDEPTASIDAEAEYKIFNKVYDFIKDKTVIIISHRFSTVRNADRIIVIDDGKIIEEGTHEDLIKLNGNYARFFKLQAKGYKIN